MNCIVAYYVPTPSKKEGVKSGKKFQEWKDISVPLEKENFYGIDSINIVEPAVGSESDPKWLLTHHREGQMENK